MRPDRSVPFWQLKHSIGRGLRGLIRPNDQVVTILRALEDADDNVFLVNRQIGIALRQLAVWMKGLDERKRTLIQFRRAAYGARLFPTGRVGQEGIGKMLN